MTTPYPKTCALLKRNGIDQNRVAVERPEVGQQLLFGHPFERVRTSFIVKVEEVWA